MPGVSVSVVFIPVKILKYDLALIVLLILEDLFLYVLPARQVTGQTLNACCSFVISLAIGVVVIRKFFGHETTYSKQESPPSRLLYFGGAALVLLFVGLYAAKKIHDVQYAGNSDIIPAVRILAQRFLAGQEVYARDAWAPIQQTNRPGYLPLHWLPFVVSERFHFDARVVVATIVWCALAFVLWRGRNAGDTAVRYSIPALLAISMGILFHDAPNILGVTVEMMIAGYYVLLMMSMAQQHYLRLAIVMIPCLLSRYYIVIWLPLFYWVQYLQGNGKMLVKLTIALVCMVVVLYIIPFFPFDHTAGESGQAGYDRAALGEWHHLDKMGRPLHLYLGNGFAYLFYEHFRDKDMPAGIQALKITLLCVSILSVVVMGIWYRVYRSRIHPAIFLMASFKLFLIFFLAFIIVPYYYLMVTASLCSWAIFTEQARYGFKAQAADYFSLRIKGYGAQKMEPDSLSP